jgi:hypothetical protein
LGPVIRRAKPPIFLIPRERGARGYKSIQLDGCESDSVFYAPISKGYGMQDVSSFTMGPVKTEGVYTGLCLVNSAFSMIITIDHIDGTLDLKERVFGVQIEIPNITFNIKMMII